LSDTAENTDIIINAAELLAGFSDVDAGDTLSVANLTANNGVLVDNNDGTYTFTPTADFNGAVILNYDVTDGTDTLTGQTQTFSVTPVNDAPTGSPTATLSNTAEDTAITITAANLLAGFSDVEGDTLSVVNLTANNGALVNNNDGTYTFTPTANFNGAVNLSYGVSDGTVTLAGQTRSFSVTPVNDIATITGTATAAITEDAATNLTATGSLTVSDVDTNESVFNTTVTSVGNLGSLSITQNGAYSYSVANSAVQYLGAGQTKTETFTVQSVDGTASQNVVVTINGVNDAPTGSPTATLSNTAEDTAITITAANLLAGFSDVDGNTLSVVNLTANNGALVNNNNGTYTFTPTANFNGAVNLSYGVSDGTVTLAGQTQTFSVTAVNDAPVGVNDSATTAFNTALTIQASTLLANDTDVDNSVFSITGVSGVSNGTAVINNNGTATNTADDYIVFTPTTGFSGNATFNYTVSDSSLIGTASVFVAVGASITGGNGQDNITGTAGNDLIDGGNQNDILYGGGGNDYLYGGNGNDILYGDGFLGGGNGVDYLYGGNGDDILYGGMGNDVVTGNNGKDIFALAPEDGIDTITDFVDGQDKIGLYNGLTYGSLTISATNLGAEIAYGNSILAYLSGINANVINSTDFVNL
jgi:VCBS repeat-containing protein